MTTAIPVDALLASVKPLTNADLSDKTVNGAGLFDELMTAFSAHLTSQLEKNRISGSDYATVYLGGVQACMQNAIQYLTTRDQAYAQVLATAAQIEATQAQTALAEKDLELKEIELSIQAQNLEIAKADLALKEAQLPLVQAQVDQANAQVKLVNAQVTDTTTKTPLEAALLTAQATQAAAQTALVNAQTAQSTKQTALITQQIAESVANVTSITAQVSLLNQKRETEIAQTADKLSSGAAVGGVVASQKNLQTQQATAFTRDAEQKAAKILMDSWVTRKTVDDGVEVPTGIDTGVINAVMGNLFAKAGVA